MDSLGTQRGAAVTDPAVSILSPTLAENLTLPFPADPTLPPLSTTIDVTVQFTVSNYSLSTGGNGANVYLNGTKISPARFDTAPFILSGVAHGEFRLCIALFDAAGVELTNPESRSCTLFRVTKVCQADTDCSDQRGCNIDRCLPIANQQGFKGCAYGSDPTAANCCDNKFDCAFGDLCSDGSCVDCLVDGDCDDGKFCTVDSCAGNACQHVWQTGAEFGSLSFCCETSADCNDGDACTTDTCNPVTHACTNNAVSNPLCCNTEADCNDSNVCTLDRCISNTCRHGPVRDPNCCNAAADCEDSNPCTIDLCDELTNTCEYKIAQTGSCCTNSQECNDGDPKTVDFCQSFQCQNVVDKLYCDPTAVAGNPDFCADDGNLCTDDVCVNNQCKHVTKDGCCLSDLDCRDNDACTIDTCLNDTCGHQQKPNCCLSDGDCADGSPCTLDRCIGHACRYGPDPTVPQPCCTVNADCNDKNTCTTDTCGGDHVCQFATAANPGVCCDTIADCDDGNPFTLDSCVQHKCKHAASGQCLTNADCNDGNVCTSETCDLSQASPGTCSITNTAGCCSAGAQCNDNDSCTTDACDPATHTCTNTAVASCCTADTDCDDGNSCNEDYCVGGTCRHTASIAGCCQQNADCDDNNSCTTDSCDATSSTCAHSVVAGPACCETSAECFDGDACTKDICQSNTCFHTLIGSCCSTNIDCDDKNLCTEDVCVFGTCKHLPPNPNAAGQPLPDVCCTTDADCPDDGSPCTTERCEANGFCSFSLVQPCTFALPYVQKFDQLKPWSWYGWSITDQVPTASTKQNWLVSTGGALGPDGHARFFWAPTQAAYDSRFVSPLLDATGVTSKVTIQFTWKFQHFNSATDVGLWASTDGNWAAATPIWVDTLSASVDPLVNFELPAAFVGQKFYLAFQVSGATTFDLDYFDVDDFRVVAGVAPDFIAVSVPSLLVGKVGSVKTASIQASDADGSVLTISKVSGPTWVTVGPTAFSTALGNWRATIFVGPKAASDVGDHSVTLKVSDGQLEKVVTIPVKALLNRGWVVWSPPEVPPSQAQALRDALVANGEQVQILDDITLYDDTRPLEGIFATLGVFGGKHVLTSAENGLLVAHLNGHGRLYVEGGDVWQADPATPLRGMMHIVGKADGDQTLDGPVAGVNVTSGQDFGLAQTPLTNNFLDELDRQTSAPYNRILEHNVGAKDFATVVAYDGKPDPTNVRRYRSIGTSVPFAARLETSTGTRTQVMGAWLQFLRFGFAGCTANAECDDLEGCTLDKCVGGVCQNIAIVSCVPCADDRDCGATEACVNGDFCGAIPGTEYPSTTAATTLDTNPNDVSLSQTVTVSPAAAGGKLVSDINVKVSLAHQFSGEVKISMTHGGTTVVLKNPLLSVSSVGWYYTYDLGKPAVGSMNDFLGMPVEGDWTLTVEDTAPGFNSGLLQGWSLFMVSTSQTCTVSADCNDGNACTNEACTSGVCVASTVDCTDFVAPGIANLCTTDTCDPATGCVNGAKTCDDANTCTTDTCFGPTGACTFTQVANCNASGCTAHAQCGTDDYCDTGTGICTAIPGAAHHSSGLFPLLIPDGDPTGVNNSLVLSSTEKITNLFVKVYVTHTFRSDLDISLTHDGKTVSLHKILGSDSADDVDAVYDFDAPVDVVGYAALESGTVLGGTWTLTVKDLVPGDQGQLQYWTLYSTSTACTADADCDDGDLCTTDACSITGGVGTCSNTAVSCDDGQFCNGTETCDPLLGCQAGTPVNTDDGVACTTDSCDEVNDVLVHTPVHTACNDGEVCTDDTCSPTSGCVHAANAASCDDGLSCTVNDTCSGGSCQAGTQSTAPQCQCTTAASCPVEADKCAANYACESGTCVPVAGSATVCNGGADTACAKNTCDPATGLCGMTSVAVGVACDDGNLCTQSDVCDGGGSCVGTAPQCSDGNPCNGAESCNGATGSCVPGTPKVTDDNINCTTDLCDSQTGGVSHVPDNALCDDGDPCTADTCSASQGCIHAPNTAPCDDGDPCTQNDACNGAGQCTGQPGACSCVTDADCPSDGNLCNGTLACVNFVCQVKAGSIVTCDATADTTCTKNTCTPATGICSMRAVANSTPCDDGNACTLGDVCTGGSCGGTPRSCDDAIFCNGTESCNPLLGCQPGTPPALDDNVGCTNDFCDEQNDVVVHTVNHGNCTDGDPCTDDVCNATTGCTNPLNTAPCDDGNPCTVGDLCASGTCTAGSANPACAGCVADSDCPGWNDGNLCNGEMQCVSGSCQMVPGSTVTCDPAADTTCNTNRCDPLTGTCGMTGVTAGVSCDDGILCTENDTCDGSGACAGLAKSCDDGQYCNGVEFCNAATGLCQGGTPPTNDDSIACTSEQCDEATNQILHVPIHTSCGDANGCTDDVCDPATGCTNPNNSVVCDDGNPCTSNDICSGGSCSGTGGAPCPCSVNADCTDDGNLCNGTMKCVAGQCQVDTATIVTCNTGSDTTCSKSVCDPTTGTCGAQFTAAGVVCDDNNACTKGDTCNGNGSCTGASVQCDDGTFCNGQETCNPITGCVSGTPPTIDDGKPCTSDFCDELAKQVKHTPNNLFCDDGNVCTTDTCNPTSGCTYAPAAGPCDDGQFCTIDDLCEAGACKGGGVNPNPTCNGCTSNADCLALEDLNGDGKDDDLCNGSLICVNTKCVVQPGSVPAPCNTADDPKCFIDTCQPATGNCLLVPRPAAFPCDDGVPCTILDACDGSGTCGGTPTPCDDGLFCNGVESCDAGTGICQPGTPPSTDDGLSCTNDSCDDVGDVIVHTADDTVCDDGQFCNGPETCVPTDPTKDGRGCISGTAPVCNDGDPCTTDACDPAAAAGLGACDFSGKGPSCAGQPCSGQHAFTAGDEQCGFDDACIGGLNLGAGTCTLICGTCSSFRSGLINAVVPNNTGECLIVDMPITATGTETQDLSLRSDITHTDLGDLEISLIAPTGYGQLLHDNVGVGTQDQDVTWSSTGTSQSGAAPLQSLCKFRGLPATGTWKVRVCDNAGAAGGQLDKVHLYVQATTSDANPGNACENPIALSAADGTQQVVGDTTCARNDYAGACGGAAGADRVYKLELLSSKRVTVTAAASFDHLLYWRPGDAITCAALGSSHCTDAQAGSLGEVLSADLPPGIHYLFLDGVGGGEGSYQLTIDLQTLKANGDACAAGGDCLSGFCTDGVCCNTGCGGACRACNLAGSAGVCTFHAVASDPETECPSCEVCSGTGACIVAANGTDLKSDCTQALKSTCQNDGLCDGAGTCRLWVSGTECQAQSCAGQTLTLAFTCDGIGGCQSNGTTACDPYVCNGGGTACRSTCTVDAHCIGTHWCNAGTCEIKKNNGLTCGGGNECKSANCIDGVCCNETCGGNCEACNLAGSLGTCSGHALGSDPEGDCGICDYCDGSRACTVVPDAQDPLNHCVQSAQTGCQLDGLCDGTGSCRLWGENQAADTIVCEAQKCLGFTLHFTDFCDGAGTCADKGTKVCPNGFMCNAPQTDCRTTCSADAQCQALFWCNNGACDPKKADGQTCTGTQQCLSGNCVDGFCCDTGCTANCKSCKIAGSEGTCSFFANGLDPDDDCGVCDVCDGSGACRPITAGQDPFNECAQDLASTCQQDGTCDGGGACRLWVSPTVCVSATCTGSTKFVDDTCDGSGTCVDNGTVACDPYVCDGTGTGCLTTCSNNSHCIGTHWCNGGTCVPKKDNGATCGNTFECVSGICVDGVCCDGACGGACEACTLTWDTRTITVDGGLADWNATGNQLGAGAAGLKYYITWDATYMYVAWDGADLATDKVYIAFDQDVNPDPTRGASAIFGGVTFDGSRKPEYAIVFSGPEGPTDGVWYVPFDGAGGWAASQKVSSAPEFWAHFAGFAGNKLSELRIKRSFLGALDPDLGFAVWMWANNNAESFVWSAWPASNPTGGGTKSFTAAQFVKTGAGMCQNRAIDTDVENDCVLCEVCDGLGACAKVASGLDPLGECTQKLKASCNTDGKCDGAGACRLWAAGTICVGKTCDPATNTQFPDDLCDGSGLCVDSGSSSCDPYTCTAALTRCRTSCSAHSQCISTHYCASNKCVLKKPDGQTCGADVACQSGNCVDGVCCDTACAGGCEACNLTGKKGTCSAHPDNTDPENDCTTCQVCNGAKACRNVLDGIDPTNDCAQSGTTTCGFDGQCDGTGACRFWNTSTVCVTQTCSGFTLFTTDLCSGSGSCVDSGSQTCPNGFNCNAGGTDCRTTCAANSECQGAFYCAAPNCAPKKADGQTCASGPQCQSGFCVDGVCCESACNGTCQHCNAGITPGDAGRCQFMPQGWDKDNECGSCGYCDGTTHSCIPATAGSDPKSTCAQSAATTCGLDGTCAGVDTTTCRKWVSGTECKAASCVGTTFNNPDTCNGSGVCTDQGTQTCVPYVCSGAGDVCLTSCSNDSHCSAGNYCGGGACLAKKNNGQTCSAANQCASGNCIDGVCCNSACAGACQACNISGKLGTCTGHPANTDPENDCTLCRVCNGSSACVTVGASLDPLNECGQDPVSTCGQDGGCNGSGACRKYVPGTVCTPQSCSGSTLFNADTCNGSGTCVDKGTASCSPYVCADAVNCRTSCTANSQCVAGFYCSGNACVPKKSNGQVCAQAFECSSNHCIDGVCCNTGCNGTCESCNLSGKAGTCSAIASNTDPAGECGLCRICNGARGCTDAASGADPKNQCSQQSTATCNRTGNCDGIGGCQLYANGTVCVNQSCIGSTLYAADRCNGNGTCVDSGGTTCPNNLNCNAAQTACLTSCTSDTQCQAGSWCNTAVNQCQPKKSNGQTCGGANQCASNQCIDGVCCNNACGGTCQACNVSGKLGTCTNFANNTDPQGECSGVCRSCNGNGACKNTTNNTDPENDCAQQSTSTCQRDGFCDGAGACGLWASGTTCVNQSCSGGTLFPKDTCNGSGTCVDSGSSSCNGYQCANATSCRTSCSNDTHCLGTHYCSGSVCVPKKANGLSCSARTQCQSNQCIDGVCCNSACGGTCQACNLAGSLGACTAIPNNTDPANECGLCKVCNGASACKGASNGTDPKGQCSQQAASTCQRDGQCNGAGACRLWASGTVCAADTCVGLTRTPQRTCNGTGTCNAAAPVSCDDGNICTVDSCSTAGTGSCGHNGPGANGTVCQAGSCNTTACSRGSCSCAVGAKTCSNGSCTGGGAAAQCKTGVDCKGSKCSGGTCTLVNLANGTVTHSKRCLVGVYGGGSGPASKRYGVSHADDTCNGGGGVNDGARTSCYPYMCREITGSPSCRNECYKSGAADGDACSEGATCIQNTSNPGFICTTPWPP